MFLTSPGLADPTRQLLGRNVCWLENPKPVPFPLQQSSTRPGHLKSLCQLEQFVGFCLEMAASIVKTAQKPALNKRQVNPQPETEGVTFAGTFANVKLESSPPSLAPHEVQPSERGLLQGQMFLVKAENQQNSNEPKVVHQTNCASCLAEKHPRRTDGTPSGSSAVTKAASKQCIFYPVKEEESEILVEPPLSEKVTTVPEEQTECISQVILAPELPRPFTISLPEFRHGV
ncbi:uncharacterized protein LOC143473283 isoform X5 [Brachyhypopomus gauderio]|uniref:uncharacterized protein LOC143473283 isoform X5 n=1 Tax=Brachyhypopomus gauderio TaxID=698409 RepID=UPI004042E38F